MRMSLFSKLPPGAIFFCAIRECDRFEVFLKIVEAEVYYDNECATVNAFSLQNCRPAEITDDGDVIVDEIEFVPLGKTLWIGAHTDSEGGYGPFQVPYIVLADDLCIIPNSMDGLYFKNCTPVKGVVFGSWALATYNSPSFHEQKEVIEKITANLVY